MQNTSKCQHTLHGYLTCNCRREYRDLPKYRALVCSPTQSSSGYPKKLSLITGSAGTRPAAKLKHYSRSQLAPAIKSAPLGANDTALTLN